MKSLRFVILISIAFSSLQSFALPVEGVKTYSGKLESGQICQLVYGPAIRSDANHWQVKDFKFNLGEKKFELAGPTLVSSDLNLTDYLLVGSGVLNRKIVITSEILGVGYETGTSIDFIINLNNQANPTGFSVAISNYRNEYVFGSWVDGDRDQPQVLICHL